MGGLAGDGKIGIMEDGAMGDDSVGGLMLVCRRRV